MHGVWFYTPEARPLWAQWRKQAFRSQGTRLILLGVLGLAFAAVGQESAVDRTGESARTPAANALPPKPTSYAHGFGLGARTTLPTLPFTAVAVSYDFYIARIEGAFGMRFATDDATNAADLLGGFITVVFPIHRIGNADFGLAGGPGVTYEHPGPQADGSRPDSRTIWQVLAGARIRVFTALQFALIGTLGAGVLIENTGAVSWFTGAQPFGAIGFYYYFR